MADDESYDAFLTQANRYTSQSTSPKQHNSSLILSSESDEPWVTFELAGRKADSADDFAKLVNQEQGRANFVKLDSDSPYKQAAEYVIQQSGSRHTRDLTVVEIQQGTRTHVYITIYHMEDGTYRGLKSLKIET